MVRTATQFGARPLRGEMMATYYVIQNGKETEFTADEMIYDDEKGVYTFKLKGEEVGQVYGSIDSWRKEEPPQPGFLVL